MKILNRDDFLNMPEGTLFSKGKSHTFNRIYVYGGRYAEKEFVLLDLTWWGAEDSADMWDKADRALDHGESLKMEDGFMRDGLFDDDETYLVYEKDDLLQLRSYIDEALKLHT